MVKIGLLTGMEETFPLAFMEQVQKQSGGRVAAELIRLGGSRQAEGCEYALIIDRLSHQVKYYRAYLKNAALAGTRVVNNPFWRDADDKFFQYSLASRLGIAVPRTMVLPQQRVAEGVAPQDLRNLVYPLDWNRIVDYVGFPAILKPYVGGSWRHIYQVNSMDELLETYNQTGELCMVLQECIEYDHYIRCLCVAKTNILPIKYDPVLRQYIVEHEHLTEEMGLRIEQDSQRLNQALGYDVNSIEYAIRDGIPYLIDALNPAPDFSLYSLTRHYFEIVVDWMVKMALEYAEQPRELQPDLRWQKFLTS